MNTHVLSVNMENDRHAPLYPERVWSFCSIIRSWMRNSWLSLYLLTRQHIYEWTNVFKCIYLLICVYVLLLYIHVYKYILIYICWCKNEFKDYHTCNLRIYSCLCTKLKVKFKSIFVQWWQSKDAIIKFFKSSNIQNFLSESRTRP